MRTSCYACLLLEQVAMPVCQKQVRPDLIKSIL